MFSSGTHTVKIRLADRRIAAFTLAEIVISSAIGALTVGATIYGYILAAKRAEWAGYSLAAGSLALQGLEQARACKWDPLANPPVDQLQQANFPLVTNILDIPMSGTNILWATNRTFITVVTTNPPLKMIRVECTWNFMGKGPFTNMMVTYRAPDQ